MEKGFNEHLLHQDIKFVKRMYPSDNLEILDFAYFVKKTFHFKLQIPKKYP